MKSNRPGNVTPRLPCNFSNVRKFRLLQRQCNQNSSNVCSLCSCWVLHIEVERTKTHTLDTNAKREAFRPGNTNNKSKDHHPQILELSSCGASNWQGQGKQPPHDSETQ
eukprot:1348833-Amphidinium_carterae.1